MITPRDQATALDALARDHHTGASMRAREHTLVAERWTMAHRSFSVVAAILAAIAGGSLFTGPGPGTIRVAAVLVLLAAIVSAADAALGATATITEHQKAADRFATLASHIARFYRVDLLDGSGEAEQAARYERIMEERDAANSASPHSPPWAQQLVKARRAGRPLKPKQPNQTQPNQTQPNQTQPNQTQSEPPSPEGANPPADRAPVEAD